MVLLWSHYYSQKRAWHHHNCNDNLSHNCIDTIYEQSFVLTWKGLSWKAHQCVQSSSKSRNHLVGINSWSSSFSHLKRTVSQGTSALSSLVCLLDSSERWFLELGELLWHRFRISSLSFRESEIDSKTKQNKKPHHNISWKVEKIIVFWGV